MRLERPVFFEDQQVELNKHEHLWRHSESFCRLAEILVNNCNGIQFMILPIYFLCFNEWFLNETWNRTFWLNFLSGICFDVTKLIRRNNIIWCINIFNIFYIRDNPRMIFLFIASSPVYFSIFHVCLNILLYCNTWLPP